MEYEKSLIDKAAKACGGDKELAQRLGTSRPNISLMRAGKRAVSPVMAAELADIAGEDVTMAVNIALISSVQGTDKERRLRDILGKALCAGGAAMLLTSCSAGWNSYTQTIVSEGNSGKHHTYRIYQKLRRLVAAAGLRRNRFFMA